MTGEWKEDYRPLPDRHKIGSVWRALDGRIFATWEGTQLRIELPKPPASHTAGEREVEQ